MVKSLKRVQNLNKVLKNNPVIVQPDPSIISIDMMPKFQIIDDKSLYKQEQKKNFATKEELIEAQMIKLK